MEERGKLRFLREEPVLALVLRKIDFKILPASLRTWALDWVEDVGRVMRSREMMVGTVASLAYYFIALGLISVFSREKAFRLLGGLL